LLRRLWLPPLPWLIPPSSGLLAMRYQPTAETLTIVERLGGRWNDRYALVPCPAHEDRGHPACRYGKGGNRSSSIALPVAMEAR
jgi:hypothetical protein